MPAGSPVIARAFADALAALFCVWRRAVTRVLRSGAGLRQTLVASATRWIDTWKTMLAYTLHAPTRAANPDTGPDLVAGFGVMAFVAGMLIAIGCAVGEGDGPATIAAAAAGGIAWAVARFWVLLLVLRGRRPRAVIARVYLAGLVPYALAVSPLLRFVALALSAALTARGLRAADVPAADVRTATVWAFGGQALVSLLGTVARDVLTVLAFT